MRALDPQSPLVGVIGAGTMGLGIAQVAASAGARVVIVDARASAAETAPARAREIWDALVRKGRLAPEERDRRLARIAAGQGLSALAGAGLVIEAVTEDLAAKRSVMEALSPQLEDGALVATNTSSLSVTAVAAACRRPEQTLGMHFFNPAPVMPLVEVVPALQTSPEAIGAAVHLLRAWDKDPIVVRDTPGFLVNRIARPFYGEALRMVEDGVARPEEVDAAVRSVGFPMGPFELMDMIGNDVNCAVTESIFRDTYFDRRYLPSALQKKHVEAGYLGRKSGRGFYTYPPGPDRDLRVAEAVAKPILRRILMLLVNEAAEALRTGLAGREDIERAMTRGMGFPRGPLHWADEIGPADVVRELETLQTRTGDARYRPSPLLRTLAREGTRFFEAGVGSGVGSPRAAAP